jgi:hypothetical protein
MAQPPPLPTTPVAAPIAATGYSTVDRLARFIPRYQQAFIAGYDWEMVLSVSAQVAAGTLPEAVARQQLAHTIQQTQARFALFVGLPVITFFVGGLTGWFFFRKR